MRQVPEEGRLPEVIIGAGNRESVGEIGERGEEIGIHYFQMVSIDSAGVRLK
jgi:hypothetical protein